MSGPTPEPKRLRRERQTLVAMLHLACRLRHGPREGLCPACEELQAYALARLGKCPFQADKPTCAHCPVHCYAPERRAQIREVMAFAGPRMLWHHPLQTLLHLWDGWRDRKRSGKR